MFNEFVLLVIEVEKGPIVTHNQFLFEPNLMAHVLQALLNLRCIQSIGRNLG